MQVKPPKPSPFQLQVVCCVHDVGKIGAGSCVKNKKENGSAR
jgi:hypothetical protein